METMENRIKSLENQYLAKSQEHFNNMKKEEKENIPANGRKEN